jgi:hypothetical protein
MSERGRILEKRRLATASVFLGKRLADVAPAVELRGCSKYRGIRAVSHSESKNKTSLAENRIQPNVTPVIHLKNRGNEYWSRTVSDLHLRFAIGTVLSLF